MDTVEELCGTYFYHGHPNLTPAELFNLIYLESFADRLGLEITSAAMILSGRANIPVAGKLSAETNTPGTSYASKLSRAIFKDLRFPLEVRPPTPLGRWSKLKFRPTNKVAAFVGRYIPFVGYAQLIVILHQVAQDSRNRYNLIARPRDRIQWTSF